MNVRIINGPNLNMLGVREPEVYGDKTYRDLVSYLKIKATTFGMKVEILQSNCEGDIISWIQDFDAYDALIVNPAGYSHTSVAILDALLLVNKPKAEVHLSNIDNREAFRRKKVTARGVDMIFMGENFESYVMAMQWMRTYAKN